VHRGLVSPEELTEWTMRAVATELDLDPSVLATP
jgi:hypothetical protein